MRFLQPSVRSWLWALWALGAGAAISIQASYLARWEWRMGKLVESLNAERSGVILAEHAYMTARRAELAATTRPAVTAWPIQRLLNSIVNVNDRGSGVVIFSGQGKSLILTAAHLIRVRAVTSTRPALSINGKIPAHVVSRSEIHDLALLLVEQELPAAPLAEMPELYEEIMLGSYPAQLGPAPTFGHVISLAADSRNNGVCTANCAPGSSGGAVFNRDGKVVGVVSSSLLSAVSTPQGSRFHVFSWITQFVPANVIRLWLRSVRKDL